MSYNTAGRQGQRWPIMEAFIPKLLLVTQIHPTPLIIHEDTEITNTLVKLSILRTNAVKL